MWPNSTGSTLSEEEIKADVIRVVRQDIGPVAAFRLVVFVPKLPKTRSGKIPRDTITKLAAGKPYNVSFGQLDIYLTCFIDVHLFLHQIFPSEET